MAVRGNANNEYLSVSGNFGGLGIINFTICGWFYTETKGANDQLMGVSHSSNGRFVGMSFSGSPALGIEDNVAHTAFATEPPNSTWFFGAVTSENLAGGTITGYWSTGGPFVTQTRTNATENSVQGDRINLGLGRSLDTTASYFGRYAAFKVWNSVLTQAELAEEMKQYLPVKSGCYLALPLFDDSSDKSGNGRSVTRTGALDSVSGPPIPFGTATPGNTIRRVSVGNGLSRNDYAS